MKLKREQINAWLRNLKSHSSPMKPLTLLLCSLFCFHCGNQSSSQHHTPRQPAKIAVSYLNPDGKTVRERFLLPAAYVRDSLPQGSFGAYLQQLPLKPHGYKALLFNGELKQPEDVYAAVIDMEIGNKDLQQCADAVIRLRGEYQFHNGLQDQIGFHFTNGSLARYTDWKAGLRPLIKGNQVSWTQQAKADDSYAGFRKYMDMVFTYAGTLSLNKELKPVGKWDDIQIGDVIIYGGSPGHCVIVVDAATHPQSGERLFLIAQSWMPAQDIHILTNPHHNPELSPWYSSRFEGDFLSAECRFSRTDLKRW